jgi:hypothetical protein
MHTPLENFYLSKPEPSRSCLLALRDIILACDSRVKTTYKYSAPFFEFNGKMFCYLWINKKSGDPYIGVVEGWRIEHEALERGDRKRMCILPVRANADLPMEAIQLVLQQALDFYRNGIIKTKEK